MKQLYLPSSGRRSSGTKRILEQTVQDNVRIDPESKQHAITNAFVAEFEYALSLSKKLEIRPWAADTQTPGSLVRSSYELDDVEMDDLLYGPPSHWDPVLIKSFEYSPSTSIGMINAAGVVVQSTGVDRVVVNKDTLICQVGSLLYRLKQFDPYGQLINPAIEGVGGSLRERFALSVITENRYGLFPGLPAQTVDVSVEIKGVDLLVGDTGVFTITVNYLASATVADQDDLSALPDFNSALHLYDDNNDRIDYTLAGNTITIATGDAPYRIFYDAVHVYNYTTPEAVLNEPIYLNDSFFISFADIAENMYRMIEEVEASQSIDILAFVPGLTSRIPIDAQGFVGRVNVGHTIKSFIATEHHIVVANDSIISLVEHDNESLILQQEFNDVTISGLCWTEDGELGMITASDAGFDVYALRDVRNKRSGEWKIYS